MGKTASLGADRQGGGGCYIRSNSTCRQQLPSPCRPFLPLILLFATRRTPLWVSVRTRALCRRGRAVPHVCVVSGCLVLRHESRPPFDVSGGLFLSNILDSKCFGAKLNACNHLHCLTLCERPRRVLGSTRACVWAADATMVVFRATTVSRPLLTSMVSVQQ